MFWTILESGDRVVAAQTLYGCTLHFESWSSKYGVEVTFVDTRDPENVRRAGDNTKVIYLETPANPTLDISDIESISNIAHEKEDCVVVVDNTFLLLIYKTLRFRSRYCGSFSY